MIDFNGLLTDANIDQRRFLPYDIDQLSPNSERSCRGSLRITVADDVRSAVLAALEAAGFKFISENGDDFGKENESEVSLRRS